MKTDKKTDSTETNNNEKETFDDVNKANCSYHKRNSLRKSD
jgi:hypothetical protein